MADLRQLLTDGIASSTGPPESLDGLGRRISARRSRRRRMLALGSTPVVAALALLVVSLTGASTPNTRLVTSQGGHRQPAQQEATTASVPSTTSPGDPLGSPTTAPPPPAELVAGTDQNTLVLVSTSTLEPIRTLFPEGPGGSPGSLAFPADRTRVFYSKHDGTCASYVGSVSLAGDTPRVDFGAIDASDVALAGVDPTGTVLAVLEDLNQADCGRGSRLVLHRLGSSNDTAVPVASDACCSAAWNPDGSILAVGAGGRIELFDGQGDLPSGRPRVLVAGRGCSLGSPVFSRASGLLLTTSVCGPSGPQRQTSFLEFDVRPDHPRITTVLDLPRGQDGDIASIDASGSYLLYSTTPSIASNVVINWTITITYWRLGPDLQPVKLWDTATRYLYDPAW